MNPWKKPIWIIAALCGLVILCMVITFVVYRCAYYWQDHTIVRKLDVVLARELSISRELTQPHGAFIRLEGSGFSREPAGIGFPHIKMTRTALFANGRVPMGVTLNCSESLSLGQEGVFIQKWAHIPNGGNGLEVEADTRSRMGEDPSLRSIDALAMSADGSLVFVGRLGGIEIWDRKAKTMTHSLKGHFGAVYEFAHADQAGKLAVRCENSVRVIDLNSGNDFQWFAMLTPNESHDGRIGFSRDAKRLVGDFSGRAAGNDAAPPPPQAWVEEGVRTLARVSGSSGSFRR